MTRAAAVRALARLDLDSRTAVALVAAAVLLTIYEYFGRQGFYAVALAPALAPAGAWPAFLYSAGASVTLRLIVPWILIVAVLREPARDYGFRLPERGHGMPYVYLYLAMLPVLAAASFLPGFQATYPIFEAAYEAPGSAVLYLAAYGLRFAAVEAFFRGFILFALFPRFGYNAVLVMMVPYCMIHFDKPVGEALGSIVAGLLLGVLALRSRSWLPGAALHWAIAITMDLLALVHTRAG